MFGTGNGIFKIREIRNYLSSDIKSFEKMNVTLANHFVDNNIVILNKQTYEFMHKIIRNEGYKDAVKYKGFFIG